MAKDQDLEFNFYFGETLNGSIKKMNLNTPFWKANQGKLIKIRNRRVFGRLIWQSGVLREVWFGNIKRALFLGDMNIVSTWLGVIILRLKGAKIFYWGHGFSGKESYPKRCLRIAFNKLAHKHFVYGERAKKIMLAYGFTDSDIHIIYNSLDYGSHKKLRFNLPVNEKIQTFFINPNLPMLVFIGRLTPAKKLDLLIKAVHVLNKEVKKFNLLIIGDGSERNRLEQLCNDLLQKGSYFFYGSCYNEYEIGTLLAYSDLCVSPGNVGLTAIHSLSFGTPVCSHDNFGNQMPEHEVIEPGETGFFFKENDLNDLVQNIREWFSKVDSRDEVRKACYAVIDNKYNPQHQMQIFKNVMLANE